MESRIAPPVRVLVADSGVRFMKASAEVLTQRGFAVVLAAGPEEAFDAVRRASPNIIFYDMDMPGYEGPEALRLLARMRGGKDAFTIASSIHGGAECERLAAEAGAWDFAVRPVERDFVIETAMAIRRHLRRPRDAVRQPENPLLKTIVTDCRRPGCDGSLVSYLPRRKPSRQRTDQFETPIFTVSDGQSQGEAVDFNVLAITVCPRCYWACDGPPVAEHAGAGITRVGRMAGRPRLLRMAAEADDTLFSESRSIAAALVAMRLAIENARAQGAIDSTVELEALADLYFKAAALAHTARDESLRDRFLGEAEKICAAMLEREPCAEVYRAACRLAALYVYFTRDSDAAETLEAFERLGRPASGRTQPRDAKALEKYHSAAAKLVSSPASHRRATYPTVF